MKTTSKLNSKIAGLLAGFALLSPALTVGAEANWPNWRGADENGSTSTGSYVAAFDNEKNVKWKKSHLRFMLSCFGHYEA